MKTKHLTNLVTTFAVTCFAAALSIAPLRAKEPKFAPSEIKDRAIQRRAVEAAIWGMPAVNYRLMTAGRAGALSAAVEA